MDTNTLNHFFFLLSSPQMQDSLPPAFYRQIAGHPVINMLAGIRDGSLEVVPKKADEPTPPTAKRHKASPTN